MPKSDSDVKLKPFLTPCNMKKIISVIAVISMLIIPMNVGANETQMTFLEMAENMNKLDNYKINQSIFGDIKIAGLPTDDGTISINGDYKLSSGSIVENGGGWAKNEYSKIDGYIKIVPKSTSKTIKMCDEYSARISAEVISIFNESIYLKLNSLNVKGKKCDKTEQADIQNAVSAVDGFKGKWFRLNTNELMVNEYSSGMPDQTEIMTALQGKGAKDAVLEITDMIISQVGLGEEESNQIKTAIERFFETEFFTFKPITNGDSAGFTSFKFNKSALLQLAIDLGHQFGEELMQSDLDGLRAYLNKMSLNGMFKANDDYGICDNFLARFSLWNIEELRNLNLNYRYKISGINKMSAIETPTDFVNIEESQIPFLNTPTATEEDVEEIDWSGTEWSEPLE